MDERLPGRRYDACRGRSPCPPLDDLRNERRKLSAPGRGCPRTAEAEGHQRQQERQRDALRSPNNEAASADRGASFAAEMFALQNIKMSVLAVVDGPVELCVTRLR